MVSPYIIVVFALFYNYFVSSQEMMKKKIEIDRKDLLNEVFMRINELRIAYKVPILLWDPILDKSAQMWANRCATLDKYEHSHTKGLGENICWMSNFEYKEGREDLLGYKLYSLWGQEIVWLNVDGKFPNISTDPSKDVRHISQNLWGNTRRVGFGLALNDSSRTIFLVAQFDPPGNIMGQRILDYKQ